MILALKMSYNHNYFGLRDKTLPIMLVKPDFHVSLFIGDIFRINFLLQWQQYIADDSR